MREVTAKPYVISLEIFPLFNLTAEIMTKATKKKEVIMNWDLFNQVSPKS